MTKTWVVQVVGSFTVEAKTYDEALAKGIECIQTHSAADMGIEIEDDGVYQYDDITVST